MSNEITVSASLSGYKSTIMSAALSRSFTALQFNMTANVIAYGVKSVGTSEEQVPLGEVTTPHWSFWFNNDDTNFVKILAGSGGTAFARLYPGEGALIPLDIALAPYLIADTAACLVEFVIFGK